MIVYTLQSKSVNADQRDLTGDGSLACCDWPHIYEYFLHFAFVLLLAQTCQCEHLILLDCSVDIHLSNKQVIYDAVKTFELSMSRIPLL